MGCVVSNWTTYTHRGFGRTEQEENAEIFKLLTIINKPAYKVLFDFGNDDKIIICNKKEIGEAWEKSKDEVEKIFGSDDSIKNFLALSKEGYDSFENEMKDSLLIIHYGRWFGGENHLLLALLLLV